MKKAQPIDESRENVEQAAAETESDGLEEQAVEDASELSEDAEAVNQPQAATDEEPLAASDDEPLAADDGSDPAGDGEEPQAAAEGASQPPLPHLLPTPDERRALLEAIVYVAEEPLAAAQIAEGLGLPAEVVQADLEHLAAETQAGARGIEIRQVAGGYKMFTKAEHHDSIRQFVKTLRPKLRLSLPALETLAVIAYKQPVTVPEIQAIRGVNAGGVIHTLLNHKLISTAGRKKVIGRPMQYKTTKEFLVQFGLNDLSELPNLKELEELSRAALGEGEEPEPSPVSGTDHSAEHSAATTGGGEEDSQHETGFADAAEDSAHEQDLAASSPPTAVASAAAAGAGRVASPVSEDAPDDGHET